MSASSKSKQIRGVPEASMPTNRFSLMNGCLFSGEQSISYWPIEVSQFVFVVLCDVEPKATDNISLCNDTCTISLKVEHVESNYRGSVFYLCRMRAASRDASIEDLLKSAPELKRWNAQRFASEPIRLPFGQIFVRSARFRPNLELQVGARTFGARGDYALIAENISKTGLLLRDIETITPFSENTILEITIDPGQVVLQHPVKCLGKVVRVDKIDASEDKSKPIIGVLILEIEPAHRSVWMEFVEKVERDDQV